jgi:hypothetical protein
MVVAWFGLSNHCALGVVLGQTMQVAGPNATDGEHCPHHPASSKKTPAKDGSAPCCKQLKVTKNADWLPKFSVMLLPILPAFLSSELDVVAPNAQPVPEIRDTGPPRTLLSEVVMKRCTRSNAPPLA